MEMMLKPSFVLESPLLKRKQNLVCIEQIFLKKKKDFEYFTFEL